MSYLPSSIFSATKKQQLKFNLPETLPHIPPEQQQKYNKLFELKSLVVSGAYDFINESFILVTLNDYVLHIEKFVTAMKFIINTLPLAYKKKIGREPYNQLRLFSVIEKWDMNFISKEATILQYKPRDVTVEKMIPFVFSVYRPVIQILFLGTVSFNSLLSKIPLEIKGKTHIAEDRLQDAVAEAIGEWSYIYKTIVPGLSPFLMRMCGADCTSMQAFLDNYILQTLAFLSLKKEDIILPKPYEPVPLTEVEEVVITGGGSSLVIKEETPVERGLKLLDKLFPEAGWLELEENPDMYPYFQPLFDFPEGFNLLSPENPLQRAVVLMRIMEDLFPGCTSIKFTETSPAASVHMTVEEIDNSIADWYLYRMNVFDKEYSKSLTEYVNRIYSQKDFKTTVFGMKTLSSILWLERTEFFPFLKFDFNYIEKENLLQGKLPVCKKVARLASYFNWLSDNIDKALKLNGNNPGNDVEGVKNPWEKFSFSITNTTSYRLQVILSQQGAFGLTNASLLKAIADIMTVFDWYANDQKSAAYTDKIGIPYRFDETTNEPVFSVDQRKDVDVLFEKSQKNRSV